MFDPIIKRTVKKSFDKVGKMEPICHLYANVYFFYVRESIALNGNIYTI